LNDLPEPAGRGCYTAGNAMVNIPIPGRRGTASVPFRATILGRG